MAERRIQLDHAGFLKEFADWDDYEQNRNVRFTEPAAGIRELLSGDILSYEQRIQVSVDSGWVGSYCYTNGAVLCFTDSSEGWRQMKRGLLYCYWHDRIAYRARDFWDVPEGEKKRPFELVSSLTNEAALALPIARAEGIWLLDLLERGLTDGSLWWDGNDFYGAYLLRLYRKLKQEEDIKDVPPKAEAWEHPFGDLIDQWDDEEKLGNAILAMCDYHLRWNRDDTEEHDAEFGVPFAIVNPVEIHALEAVRSELGLSTPRVEHELLQPPFYPIPDFAKNITTEEILEEDDLLRRIIEMNQPWCDGLEE